MNLNIKNSCNSLFLPAKFDKELKDLFPNYYICKLLKCLNILLEQNQQLADQFKDQVDYN